MNIDLSLTYEMSLRRNSDGTWSVTAVVDGRQMFFPRARLKRDVVLSFNLEAVSLDGTLCNDMLWNQTGRWLCTLLPDHEGHHSAGGFEAAPRWQNFF